MKAHHILSEFSLGGTAFHCCTMEFFSLLLCTNEWGWPENFEMELERLGSGEVGELGMLLAEHCEDFLQFYHVTKGFLRFGFENLSDIANRSC